MTDRTNPTSSDRLPVDCHAPGLEPGQVEDLVDQSEQALGVPEHQVALSPRLGTQRTVASVEQALERSQDQGERSANSWLRLANSRDRIWFSCSSLTFWLASCCSFRRSSAVRVSTSAVSSTSRCRRLRTRH